MSIMLYVFALSFFFTLIILAFATLTKIQTNEHVMNILGI